MQQKSAFTAAAMTAALEETGVTYEDLAEIEREFDDAETEIIKQQILLTLPLYEKRTALISKIPNFWPLVLEQAPPDVDQYIQPSDSALLTGSLLSISVSHFELDVSPKSFRIEFEFAENEVFEDKKLVKNFWFRKAKDGWAGFVSDPVPIKWKKGKDLTGGLLDLVVRADRSDKERNLTSKVKTLTEEQKALKKKIDNTGMGGLSFFAWFGYIGRRISAEESAEAVAKEKERRQNPKAGLSTPPEEEEDEEDILLELEIFPDGDDLGIAFSDDIWPRAITFFTQAQEQDALSDADFESVDGGEEGDFSAAENSQSEGEDGDERPKKKMRSE